jgi:dTDP-4-amino-4,6-dideoxygalactose transaminase
MGCAQMERIGEFVEKKRDIARRYQESLKAIRGLTLPEEASWAFGTFWMYTILVDEKETQIGSREVLRRLASQRIQTRPLWQPMHRSVAHRDSVGTSCPIADLLYAQALSLPCSVGLTVSSQRLVTETIKSIVDASKSSSGKY